MFNTRQSARFTNNEGKTIMQLAQEITKKKNLEKQNPAVAKLKGMANYNSFDVLANENLRGMAHTVG
jgi:hypothetical protein